MKINVCVQNYLQLQCMCGGEWGEGHVHKHSYNDQLMQSTGDTVKILLVNQLCNTLSSMWMWSRLNYSACDE